MSASEVGTHPQAQAQNWRWAGLLLVLGAALTLYASTLNHFWVSEEFDWAISKDANRILSFFDPTQSRHYYRPLSWLSFALDYQLWGNNPFMWHLTNLVLYLLSCALLWLLVYRLQGVLLATLAALFFALDPNNPGAVTWIVSRTDLLSTLFYLACIACFVLYRQTSRRRYYGLALAAMLLGILAKETVITIPALLLLADLLFFNPPWLTRAPSGGGWRIAGAALLRSKLWLHGPFILISIAYLLLRLWLRANHFTSFTIGSLDPYSLLRNTCGYLEMMLGWPDVGTVEGIQMVFVPLIFTLAAVAIALWAGRLAWFGLAWVFITMTGVVHIGILDLNTRYAYLPTIGLALLLAAALGKLLRAAALLPSMVGRAQVRRVPSLIALGLIVALSGFGAYGTIVHNDEWRVASELCRAYVSQVTAAHPQVTPGTRFFIADAPLIYKRTTVLYAGATNALRTAYHDDSLQAYVSNFDPASFTAAIQQPSNAPSYYFRYIGNGIFKEYPSAAALLAAP